MRHAIRYRSRSSCARASSKRTRVRFTLPKPRKHSLQVRMRDPCGDANPARPKGASNDAALAARLKACPMRVFDSLPGFLTRYPITVVCSGLTL
jgi:hypothetical protein